MNNMLHAAFTLSMSLQQNLEVLRNLAAQQNLNHFRIGQIYNHIVDNKLAEKEAKKSSQQWFSENVKTLSQAVLSTCGAVARAFTETTCERYGVNNLSSLLAYAKACNFKPSADEPGPTPIAVPQKDGSVVEKPFSECTVEELKLATKSKRTPLPVPPSELEQIRIQTLRESVAKYFSEASSRTRVNSRVYMGTAYVTLQDVPVLELEKLAEALMDGLVAAITTQARPPAATISEAHAAQ
ncbi:hypothetical protein [Hyalangium gracile]|uniref:hypothetical protein n=1 Tax=Hyalangium gracile TaxID=394092 RepID=UPI001CCF5A10|nr:hypothetical protein [Hyalangium gracile]